MALHKHFDLVTIAQNISIDISIKNVEFPPSGSAPPTAMMNANQLINLSSHSLIARKIDMAADQHDRPHQHPWHQLIMPKSGTLRTRVGYTEYFVPFNRAVFIPAGCTHESWAVTPAEFIGLYLSPEKLGQVPEQCKILEVSHLYRELIYHWVASVEPLEAPSQEESRMCEVIFDLTLSQPEVEFELTLPRDPRIKLISDCLLADPTSNLSLSTWAQQSGTSERTIERLFRSETGLTFTLWRQRLRLYHSLSMLEKNIAVKIVALNVGYRSASAFIHRFKSEFGLTPRQYSSSATQK